MFSEDIVPSENLDVDVAMLHGAESLKLHPCTENIWQIYQRAVENYSGRLMTNQDDALDAFTGILRRISKSRNVEGLPAEVFDKALLWQPFDHLRPRPNFASWSWVG